MKHLYTLLLLSLPVLASAQDFPYTFEVDTQPYEEFEDGIDAVFNTWDDPTAALPMGFDFYFFERMMDTWYLSSDFLGGTLVGDIDENGTSPVFFVYGSDLIDIGYPQDSLISNITYKTTGFAPNRVFHLQYENCGFYAEVADNGTSGNRVNIQARMFEGSNDIEIHFGPHTIKDNDLAHDGLGGPPILLLDSLNYESGDFETLWLLTGEPASPDVAPVSLAQADLLGPGDFLNGNPAPNTIYRFTSSYVGVDENPSSAAQLAVFPNPTGSTCWVNAPADWANVPYTLTGLNGSRVAEGQLNAGRQSLNLETLPAGIYLLSTAESPVPVRIVKQ